MPMSDLAEIAIRPIADEDVDGVVELWQEAGVSRPWNDPQRDIAFARRDPHSTILVAVQAGQVVASAMIGEDGHRGWVYYVAVRPELKGSGLGRQIMEQAEDWLAARGCWKIQLLVRDDNAAAISFYEHLGYKDTRTTCLQKVIG